MRYFVLIDSPGKKRNTAYGVIVPDIPGCFSAGDTLDEALHHVEDAIILQLEDILERGGEIPEASMPEEIIATRQDDQDWACFGIDINLEHVSTKAKRINITMPEGVLNMVDEVAKKNHQNRSAFLTEAALDKIRHG